MSKAVKWLLRILAVLAIAALVTAGVFYFEYELPYLLAKNTMPADGVLMLSQLEDDRLQLWWPEGENTDAYILAITDEAQNVLYSQTFSDTRTCVLPQLPQDQRLTISISSSATYQLPKEEKVRLGEQMLAVTTVLTPPAVQELAYTADPEADVVDISFAMGEHETARMYVKGTDSLGKASRILREGSTRVSFGTNADYPMLTFDESKTFLFDVYREEPGLLFYGKQTGEVTVVREDLLGTTLIMSCVDEGNNVFTMTWNETKGDHYEIQVMNTKTETWETLHTVERDGERSYTTPHLERFRDYQFRVVAVGGQTLPDSDFAATPADASVSTGATAVYSTVWPLKDLAVYSDTAMTKVIGEAPAGKAYCVLDVVDNLFCVRHEDGVGYIDSNYCMINLPEYIGDLCAYNITNSYSAIYMVHEYAIPEVTDTIVKGYEKVQLYNGEYLVPLLYPAAQKLVDAAFAAKEQGYRLKIYDSFRPREATRSIYDLTAGIIYDPIPETTFSGLPVEDLPVMEEGKILTYHILMTDNGRYSQANFLAKGTSNHNLGIALDLTLEKTRNKEEVPMQTSIHDLSWYSEVKLNNKEAKLLAKIMKEAGFGTLSSEWWHFQDNDAKKQLSLTSLQKGVTPECWMADDNGWRYRRSTGRYYKDTTVKIGGVSYTFDANGYVVTP